MLGIITLYICLCSVSASEPNIQKPTSATLTVLIEQARKLAISQFPDIPVKNYAKAIISVYFASRTSGGPDGVMVSFPIRGSHRKEKLGEMEDRVIVIIHDDDTRKPEVKKISRWLYEDSIALKEY